VPRTIFGSLFSEMCTTGTCSAGVSAARQLARAAAFLPPLIVADTVKSHGCSIVLIVACLRYAAVALWAWVFPETRGRALAEPDPA
jgi:hypothetical protein